MLAFCLLVTAQIAPDAAKAYSDVLAKHVKNGRVDYKALTGENLASFDRYLDAVAKAKVPAARDDAIAFYVDAYNATVLKAVIKHGRPRSVLDVKGFFDAETHEIAGKKMTLNQLEKETLIPFAKDPRLHMVLVCAAVGCPILESEPYAGSNVGARLDKATRRYLAGPTGAVVSDGGVALSKIFDWYKADFGGEAGVIAFVKQHVTPDAAKKMGDTPKVTYVEYNWTLNQL